MMPIEAETFSSSTSQISQNCGVLCASFRCTLKVEIRDCDAGGASQPSGDQCAGGTRKLRAPPSMNTK